MKKILLIAVLAFLTAVPPLFAQFKTGTHALVDGVYNSTQAVITSRQPVFSFEFTGKVSSFTITVSSDAVFSDTGELWNYSGSTGTANTINDITRTAYGGAALSTGSVYSWQVALYDEGTLSAQSGQFTAASSAARLSAEKFDLAVDWNNPFDPSKNQITKFRFYAADRDRKMKLRVYTLSGELVMEWPEQTVLQNAVYTEPWDGKNTDGEVVARGIYLVNLTDVGENTGLTRKVAVISGNK